MIEVTEPKKCCGCQACMQVCPKKSISFVCKEDGFSYPVVDADSCVDCGLCNNVCPILVNPQLISNGAVKEFKTYAAATLDDVSLMKSSSGGIFIELAKKIVADGGYVAGCIFDSYLNVRHIITNDFDEINLMRGSKYVQSDTSDIFIKVRTILRQGFKVLFTGTPCQCAALRFFLSEKLQEKLFIVDFACHGVPSPVAWQKYLFSLKWDKLYGCNMRDKTDGWERYNFVIFGSKNGSEVCSRGQRKSNIWIRGFLSHIYNRPSCYDCKFRNGHNQSDLTISDCWGVKSLIKNITEVQRSKGLSSVVLRSEKGSKLFGEIYKELWTYELNYVKVVEYNPALKSNSKKAIGTYMFFPLLNIGVSFKATVFICCAIGKLLRWLKIR